MVSINDKRVKNCAFAKLQGSANFPDPGHYLVKKYEVVLGRKSKSSSLDVVLGDNMNISRKHAKLEYNFSVGAYQLIVLGKNGVTVGGVLYTPTSSPLSLKSRDFIQIGDTSFHFLLPKTPTSPASEPSKKRTRPESKSAPSTGRKAAHVAVKSEKHTNHKKSSGREHGRSSGDGGHASHGRRLYSEAEPDMLRRYEASYPHMDEDEHDRRGGMDYRDRQQQFEELRSMGSEEQYSD